MNAQSARLASADSSRWHDLYVFALLEADKSKIYARIAKAELALLERQRELFANSYGATENEQVSNALDRALKPFLHPKRPLEAA